MGLLCLTFTLGVYIPNVTHIPSFFVLHTNCVSIYCTELAFAFLLVSLSIAAIILEIQLYLTYILISVVFSNTIYQLNVTIC